MLINHTLINVKSILTLAMFRKLYVAMTINLVNQCKLSKVKKQFINLLKVVWRSWLLLRKYKETFEKSSHQNGKRKQKRF